MMFLVYLARLYSVNQITSKQMTVCSTCQSPPELESCKQHSISCDQIESLQRHSLSHNRALAVNAAAVWVSITMQQPFMQCSAPANNYNIDSLMCTSSCCLLCCACQCSAADSTAFKLCAKFVRIMARTSLNSCTIAMVHFCQIDCPRWLHSAF